VPITELICPEGSLVAKPRGAKACVPAEDPA